MTSRQQKTQVVYLSSKDATKNNSTYLSDVSFQLPRPIVKPKDTILCVKVAQFIFPLSVYNVNSTNNQIDLYEDDVFVSTIVIPEGNYSVDTLLTELETQFGENYTITYDYATMKYTFAHDTKKFMFESNSTALTMLGFPASTDATATLDTIYYLSSTYPSDLSYLNCVYVAIPNLSINNINSKGERSQIVACVPVDQLTGTMIVYNNDLGISIHTQEEMVSEFHIKIYDEDQSTLLNFQNQNWFMTLETSYTPI